MPLFSSVLSSPLWVLDKRPLSDITDVARDSATSSCHKCYVYLGDLCKDRQKTTGDIDIYQDNGWRLPVMIPTQDN